MNPKEVKNSIEARELLKTGVNLLADAVGCTLGAKGRLVVYENAYGQAITTKDGVTVAKLINDDNKFINMGIEMVKEAAIKTNELANDGTTTSTVLAQGMINEGLKNVTAGANPMDLKRGIDKAVAVVVDSLKEMAKPVASDSDMIQQVAIISANGEQEIGINISNAIKKVSKDGVVTIENSSLMATDIKIVEGMQLNRGLLNNYFITNPAKMECVLDNPLILITDRKITRIDDLVHFLEPISTNRDSVLIICETMEGEALSTLVANKMQNNLKVCVIEAPAFGNSKIEVMKDIAFLTDATVITESLGFKLSEATMDMLGGAEKIIVTRDTTSILNGRGSKEVIATRVAELKFAASESDNEAEKFYLKDRAAKLANGAAVIRVGAPTQLEMKEKKDRYDDALGATRAALEEGIVAGGGVAFIRCIKSLEGLTGSNPDENTGIDIVRKALESPLHRIAENAGKSGDVIVQKVKEGFDDYGYNVRTDTYEGFFRTGVIDPVKVSRVAIQNAASVAGMLLITECVVVNKIVAKS